MKFEAVYHIASDNYCYMNNNNELIVNLKTGYDVEEVYIHYGDPFATGILGAQNNWEGVRLPVFFKKRLAHQLWWTTTIVPQYKRCRYFFELVSREEYGGERETWYYFEDGVLSDEQVHLEGKMLQCFTFPWMNPSDINYTPKWVNDAVWYQIFPERFCNGNPEINPEGTLPWADDTTPVNNEQFYGGDLQGIINRLDYLADLGITGIYVTPIFEAPSAHKYNTTDYMKIDHHFGDEETFRELVDKAHERGIKIMLDGVFNHCGEFFGPWQDVLAHGPESKYYNWFMINQWPIDRDRWDTRDGKFYSFGFFSNMPKLNTNNPELVEYLVGVIEYWAKEFHIDGIRLDVANEISHQFCKTLRYTLKKIDPDFYILGEIWHNAMPWLRGDEFDSVMNYPLSHSITDFWIDRSRKKRDFEYMVNRCYTMYMQHTNDVLFNLLDSHDTDRVFRRNHCNMDLVYQQLAVIFTMPGSPCIYYGTEIGMDGGGDPDCRRCMPWEKIDAGWFTDRINMVKRLIWLRKNEPLFRSRNFHFPNEISNDRVIEYLKLDCENHQLKIILNCSDVSVETPYMEGKEIFFANLYDNGWLHPNGVVIVRW